jgi:dTDP-glucose 4,6-dehydratase/UDP-glucose 4-epimerase
LSPYKNAKVLITGGLGFIGSNLGRKLVSQEAKVTLVDSLIPQYGGNKFNIDDFRDEVSVNICDVRDAFAIASLIQAKTTSSIWLGRPVT